MESYLEKQSIIVKHWRERYFVLEKKKKKNQIVLSYYGNQKKRQDGKSRPLGEFHLCDRTVANFHDKFLILTLPTRTFILRSNEKKKLSKWKRAFRKMKVRVSKGISTPTTVGGGIFKSIISESMVSLMESSINSQDVSITTHDVRIWDHKNVMEWLEKVSYGVFTEYETDMVAFVFKERQVDGRRLSELDEDDIDELFNCEEEEDDESSTTSSTGYDDDDTLSRDHFFCCVRDLKMNKVFDDKMFNCLLKLYGSRAIQRKNYSALSLYLYAQKIIDPKKMVNSIFSLSRDKNLHLLRKNTENGGTTLKVKLVITGIGGNELFKQLASPIISVLPSVKQDFGLFHTALIVGPWYFEWTNDSLCKPRGMESRMSFIAMDIHQITVETKEITDLLFKMAKIVAKWNSYYTYSKTKEIAKGNCQDFVDDFLNDLNIKPKFSEVFETFLKRIKTTGKSQLIFQPTPRFVKHFKFTQKSPYKIEFESHKDLDVYATELKKRNPMVHVQFAAEWMLLKAFDRAFWLKYYSKGSDQKSTPLGGGSKKLSHKCPFLDPSVTGSFSPPTISVSTISLNKTFPDSTTKE